MADKLVANADGSNTVNTLKDMGDGTHAPLAAASMATLLAGENQAFDRMFGGALASYAVSTADALVKTGAGVFYGCTVQVALSAATVVIRDSTTAGAGTIIAVLPASSAIGYTLHFGGVGVAFTTGLYIDFGGTGTVATLYV